MASFDTCSSIYWEIVFFCFKEGGYDGLGGRILVDKLLFERLIIVDISGNFY